jgi:hypothetical protein
MKSTASFKKHMICFVEKRMHTCRLSEVGQTKLATVCDGCFSLISYVMYEVCLFFSF